MFKFILILAFSAATNCSNMWSLVNKSHLAFDSGILTLTELEINEIIKIGMNNAIENNLDVQQYLNSLNSKVKQEILLYQSKVENKNRDQYLWLSIRCASVTLGLIGLGFLFYKCFKKEEAEFLECANFLRSNGVNYIKKMVYAGRYPEWRFRFTAPYEGLSYRKMTDIEITKDILIDKANYAEAWLMGELMSFGFATYTGFYALRHLYKWSPLGYKIKIKKYRKIQEVIKARLDELDQKSCALS